MIGSMLETGEPNIDRLRREIAGLMDDLRASGVDASHEIVSIGGPTLANGHGMPAARATAWSRFTV